MTPKNINQVLLQDSTDTTVLPNPINKQWKLNNAEINTLLEEAIEGWESLNAFSTLRGRGCFYQNAHCERSYSIQRIERNMYPKGTRLYWKQRISALIRDDWQEVQNYIEAMNHSIKTLKNCHCLPN